MLTAMEGIVFSGSACRLAFGAGVAAAFADAGRVIPLAAGASSGSLVAAAVAAQRGAELPRAILRLADRPIVSLRRALHNRSPFDMSTIVRDAIVDFFGDCDLRHAPGEAVCTATKLPRLRPVVYSTRDEPSFLLPMLGSCFFPVLYGRPIRYRGSWLLDGGAIDNVPIGPLVERGARRVFVVVPNPDGTALRRLGHRGWRPRHADPAVRVEIVAPARPLALRSWELTRAPLEAALDEGYRAGRRVLG